jgi:nitrite reductase/ring-hydroxylating ferredoxin subunit
MTWMATVPEDRLEQGRVTVVRCGPRQIALRRSGGRLYAFDNRCPHEGYPLSEGRLGAACVLTCEWHNWKFDLADGHNLFGTDHLRVYPTRVAAGVVEVDVAESDPGRLRSEVLASLRDAFDDRQYGRLARGLARLHFEGLDPVLALEQAVHWTAERLEYGSTHAFAASADWLALHDEAHGDAERALVPLLEALDHMAHDALRQPVHAFPEASGTWSETAFAEAVEAEDERAAISCLNGALAAGRRFEELEAALARTALAHYRDFGHALIYVQKTGALIQRLGDSVAAPLLRSLARGFVYSTCEDRVPGFRGYAERLHRAQARPPATGTTPPALPFGLGVKRSLDRVVDALGECAPEAVLDALVENAGRNLLGFDTGFGERDDVTVSRSVGWLDLTHAVTFAAALRELAGRHPELWLPGLLQLACFTGRMQPFLDREADAAAWRVEDPGTFFEAAVAGLLDHGEPQPIVACHRLKTTLAARELAPALGENARAALLAGLRRFLESPLKQKHVRRTLRQALGLVGLDYETVERKPRPAAAARAPSPLPAS